MNQRVKYVSFASHLFGSDWPQDYADTLQVGGIKRWNRTWKDKLFPSYSNTYHFTEDSYPSFLAGSGGSGRTRSLISMVRENLSRKIPFVYLNARGDISTYTLLAAGAIHAGYTEHLYLLNGFTLDPQLTNTIDPVNPLVGDEDSFKLIFGEEFGPVLNALCMTMRAAAKSIDFEALESFLELEVLRNHASAIHLVGNYLEDISTSTQRIEDFHQERTAIARKVIQLLKSMPMFSFDPDIDMAAIYARSRFLCINLPSVEKNPDNLNVLTDLFTCLVSKSIPAGKSSFGLPSFIIDSGYVPANSAVPVLERFRKTNTIFAYEYEWLGDWSTKISNVKSQRLVVDMLNSAVFMKIESDIYDFFKIKAFDNGVSRRDLYVRDLTRQHPGEAHIWGNIAIKRKGLLDRQATFERARSVCRVQLELFNPPTKDIELKINRQKIASQRF